MKTKINNSNNPFMIGRKRYATGSLKGAWQIYNTSTGYEFPGVDGPIYFIKTNELNNTVWIEIITKGSIELKKYSHSDFGTGYIIPKEFKDKYVQLYREKPESSTTAMTKTGDSVILTYTTGSDSGSVSTNTSIFTTPLTTTGIVDNPLDADTDNTDTEETNYTKWLVIGVAVLFLLLIIKKRKK